jgi:hypothetical protein
MVMKESLVSQVDSTETLAPGAAGGERLDMAYRTGISGFVAILSADAAGAAGFATFRPFSSDDFGG